MRNVVKKRKGKKEKCEVGKEGKFTNTNDTGLPTKNETIKTTWNTSNTLLCKERSNFIVVGNHEHKKTDFLNAVESYLKSHPFLITL